MYSGMVIKLNYEYLETGELRKVVDPKLEEVLYNYDDLGRLASKQDRHGILQTFLYDENGNLKEETINGYL